MSLQCWTRPGLLCIALQTVILGSPGVEPVVAQGPASEPIRLLRAPALSPDARTVAFAFAGDIWLASTDGGLAQPLTLHEAHDTAPIWSPDGRLLAFASNRNGDYDVYVVPAEGGRPTRLTWGAGTDVPCAFSPDGKSVLFRSNRHPEFPSETDLYTVPVTGGTPRKITRAGGSYGVYSPDGRHIAYVRGYGSIWRRGYRGSANNQIWICRADGSDNRRVTDFEGDDSSPMFSADGSRLLLVCDRSGTRNLWEIDLAGVMTANQVGVTSSTLAPPRQLTFHVNGEVRRAKISHDRRMVCYEFDHQLWLYDTATQRCREVRIFARPDDKVNPTELLALTGGATEMEPSPDDRQVALVLRGEIFVVGADGGNANRITNSPANDHDVIWTPDSRRLIYVSDSTGVNQIYLAESSDPKRPNLSEARSIKISRFSKSSQPETQPQLSPDGKTLLFLRGDDLWVAALDGSTPPKQLVKGPGLGSVAWSPDSKWVAYVGADADWGTDVYLIPAAGGQSTNITRWGTSHNWLQWTRDGRQILYSARHDKTWNIYVHELRRPLADGQKDTRAGNTVEIDFDDIHLRIRRAVGLGSDQVVPVVDGNGKTVAFVSDVLGAGDLWTSGVAGGTINRLATGVRPRRMVWNRTSNGLWVLDGTGSVRQYLLGLPPAPGANTPVKPLSFKAEMEIDRATDFRALFQQAWRMLADRFYDPTFHGTDWQAVRDRYGPLVDYCTLKEELQELLQEMIGELNASHLGVTISGRSGGRASGFLGLSFDPSYSGPGLKISEVLPNGPCDRRGLAIKPGDVLLRVDGQAVGFDGGPTADLDRALLGKIGNTVVLTVQPAAAHGAPVPAALELDVRPVGADVISNLSYLQWVGRNAQLVDKLSGGKLGYVHIRAMDEPSLEQFRRQLFTDVRDKAALIIDVRFNGGGFTHDSVLDLLGGKIHTHFVQRGGEVGSVMRNWNRKWAKPALVVINERSASDAEIFPNAFRQLGLGKLVGRTTMGAVIGTYNVKLLDGTTFRIPRTGVYTASDGQNLENWGVRPDYNVENHPDELAGGVDRQLARSVEVLLAELAGKPIPPNLPSRRGLSGPARN